MYNVKFLVDDFKGWSLFDYTWLAVACASIILITLMMGGSTLSIISALANVVCVILVAQGKLSNYVWGLVGVITYAFLAFTWGYYGETFLNAIYYLPMQFIGFYLWSKNSDNVDDTVSSTVVVSDLSKLQRLLLAICVPILIFGFAAILNLLGGKLALLDATTTILSIVAMVLMAARLKEQWYLWIIVNIVSIYMWFQAFMLGSPDGIATLLMWSVFLMNALYGLIKWHKRS